MTARMTAAKARALLAGATPGPWMHCHTLDRSGAESWSVLGQDFKDIVRTVSSRQRGDTRLAAAAPDLAATVIAQAEEIERVRTLLDRYRRDDREHLATFGQHHPVAGIAYDHLTEALEARDE